MFPIDSSSSPSPFSTQSTFASSPEASTGGEQGAAGSSARKPNGHVGMANGADMMQNVHALIESFNNGTFQSFSGEPRTLPSVQPDVKPFGNIPPPPPQQSRNPRPNQSGASSAAGAHGGTRTEPPKRKIEVDGLAVTNLGADDLVQSSTRNKMLLQGDPQVINKQRVETAIRVIVDLLRMIPPSPANPLLPSNLAALLPDSGGTGLRAGLERIGTFKAIRLQAGATTKLSSKKQLQAGPTPKDQIAYLETAVYTSGDNPKRVYPCKRCRAREMRRKETKEANRRKQDSSGSDTSSSKPRPTRPSLQPPSLDYITADNPQDYDPLRVNQTVEDPSWDPNLPDWRHEMVLYNTPPEVQVKDGSIYWLPFRVVCYGKCHGEKAGFRIKFTLRTLDGRIIVSEMTEPIRITDDHKTDSTKPKAKGQAAPSSASASVSRGRKGRASVASSRVQSPTPSEAESIQSAISEAGPMVRQTHQARNARPYDRPAAPTPNTALGDPNGYHHPASAPSMQSAVPQGRAWPQGTFEWPVAQGPPTSTSGTVSPGALRRPNFSGFTPVDASSAPVSAAPSNVASPIPDSASLPAQDDLLFMRDALQSPTSLTSALAFAHLTDNQPLPAQTPMMYNTNQMAPPAGSSLGILNDLLSQDGSISSGFRDDASAFSGSGFADESVYSQSGLPPDSMERFLDYTGGDDQMLQQPFPATTLSPTMGQTSALPFDMPNFLNNPGANRPVPPPSAQNVALAQTQMEQNIQLQQLIQAMAQQQPRQPVAPPPTITHVIPGQGPVAGGERIAVAGSRFSPQTKVLFGDRLAETQFVSDGFLQCTLPAGYRLGPVDVTVAGVQSIPGVPVQKFVYIGMERDLMMLALQTRDVHQSSQNTQTYQHFRTGSSQSPGSGSWGDRSSLSPHGGSFSSPREADGPDEPGAGQLSMSSDPEKDPDLQLTIINFLASLDESSPGSLRRSKAVNHRNAARQTMLHLAAVLGYHKLLRRLFVYGAHLNLQDVNGFTALALASYSGQTQSVRVLIEAGAAYDYPTLMGELPLDLAQLRENGAVSQLLVSAVWQQSADDSPPKRATKIDEDNPSSDSEDDVSIDIPVVPMARRRSRQRKGKQRASRRGSMVSNGSISSAALASPSRSRRSSLSSTPVPTPVRGQTPADDPPPYEARDDKAATIEHGPDGSWLSWGLSTLPGPLVNSHILHHPHLKSFIPSVLSSPSSSEKAPRSGVDNTGSNGWITLPLPSWETLQGLPSSDEIRVYSQTVAALARTMVSTSASDAGGAVAESHGRERDARDRSSGKKSRRSKPRQSSRGSRSDGSASGASSVDGMVQMEKPDRMLYLFWLPILLFFGFWLMVTALPIITTCGLIYGRQIYRAVKHRM